MYVMRIPVYVMTKSTRIKGVMRITHELIILRLFCENRDTHDNYYLYLKNISNLDINIKLVLNLVGKYYQQYNTDSIKESELLGYFDLCYPKHRNQQVFLTLIKDVFKSTVQNKQVVIDLVEQLMETYHAASIVDKLLPVLEGQKFGILPSVAGDVEKFTKKLTNPPDELKELVPCTTGVHDLLEADLVQGYTWTLDSLNSAIGGLKGGSNGLVYAFVDSGKTSFGVSSCANFAYQIKDTDNCIVYGGNEESAARIRLRMIQAMLGLPKSELHKKGYKWIEKWISNYGFDKIKLFDGVSHIDQVRRLLDKFGPVIMYVDQGTRVAYPGFTIGDVSHGEQVFNAYRDFGKEYGADMISLAQAASIAENKQYLAMTDLYNNKVSIAGTLDWAIAIGRRVDDENLQNLRYFSTPKNKMRDGDNVKFQSYFDRHRCRFKEN
jgi:hypothetical protein